MNNAALKTSATTLALSGEMTPEYKTILTPEAQAFVAELATRFTARRNALLAKRVERQKRIDAGEMPDFRADTKALRDADWRVAPIPADLQDRRVEITGPVERKMIINALNSGAKVFMADFEDSLAPTWQSVMEGQLNLRDYANRTISYTSPEGKEYKLADKIATLIVRPRGWHLDEKHVTLAGKPIPGALLDFGVYFYVNAKTLLASGTGPYFYLPKLESAEEAQLWADIFAYSEDSLGLKRGTIKATVLIETILATFEMDEIMHALKDYCVGLNCGRWDYIFSFIKKFSKKPEFVLPDRSAVTMTTHFLRSYSKLLIEQTHRRGVFAMGGMSAFIPVKNDEVANEKAFAMVRADKEREAGDGHDGTWVAHPGLVPVAMEVFNRLMPTPNQLHVVREKTNFTAQDLLAVPEGKITEAGLRNNISVSVQYLANWLSGNGCVPLFNLMEDAATAEIARAQIWQWIHHDKGVLDNGHAITESLYLQLLDEELGKLTDTGLPYRKAADMLTDLVTQNEFIEFLTLPGYDKLV
ncbi:MAG: malate synthase A [Alphaproteobacteria bacterium]|nr:malate synthase A [Alphaproteobacteria bacterium]